MLRYPRLLQSLLYHGNELLGNIRTVYIQESGYSMLYINANFNYNQLKDKSIKEVFNERGTMTRLEGSEVLSKDAPGRRWSFDLDELAELLVHYDAIMTLTLKCPRNSVTAKCGGGLILHYGTIGPSHQAQLVFSQ